MSEKLTRAELVRFGLVMGAVIAPLFGLLLPWLLGHGWPRWPWGLAGGFWLAALLLPAALGPVHRLWMGFGRAANWVNTRLILGVVFYLVVTPIGLVMRLLGSDPMRRKLDPSVATYRIQRGQAPHPQELERPF